MYCSTLHIPKENSCQNSKKYWIKKLLDYCHVVVSHDQIQLKIISGHVRLVLQLCLCPHFLYSAIQVVFQFVIIQYYGSTCGRKRSRKKEDEKPLLESPRDSGSFEMKSIVQKDSQRSGKLSHTDNDQD